MSAAPDHTFDVRKYDGDVTNYQAVSVGAENDQILVMSPLAVMSREQALIHAAWLVALADDSTNYEEFRKILRAVLNT